MKAPETKSVRLDVETIRLVKVAAARGGESMQAWLHCAARERLEREGKSAVGDKRRVASVRFEEGR